MDDKELFIPASELVKAGIVVQAELSTHQADISNRAVSLGRILDRLPDGEYLVRLDKGNGTWSVKIETAPVIRSVTLTGNPP